MDMNGNVTKEQRVIRGIKQGKFVIGSFPWDRVLNESKVVKESLIVYCRYRYQGGGGEYMPQ